MVNLVRQNDVLRLIDWYQTEYYEVETYFEEFRRDIESWTAVDAVEVVQAKWTDAADYVTYKCSNCLHYSSWDIEGKPYHYCPHCGARMNNNLVYELEE